MAICRGMQRIGTCRIRRFQLTVLYDSLSDLQRMCSGMIKAADFVLVGSYVRDGVQIGRWLLGTADCPVGFYDIDTPVTLAKLARADHEYLEPSLIPQYAVYFSFTGGPTLEVLEDRYGSPMARALYCSVDISKYHPEHGLPCVFDLGYLGTYSEDRQPTVSELLIEPARRLADRQFVVAGAQYPDGIDWPSNVRHIEHVAPERHRVFYCAQRYTLNVTRQDMIRRLFAKCASVRGGGGVPVISDYWPGLVTFFRPMRRFLLHGRTRILAYLCICPRADDGG